MAKTIQQLDKLRFDLIGGNQYQHSLRIASVCTYALGFIKGAQQGGVTLLLDDVLRTAIEDLELEFDTEKEKTAFLQTARRRISIIKSYKT